MALAATLALVVVEGGYPAPQGGIRLEEVLTIGGPEEETILMWTGVAVDREGFIYLLDAMDHSVKKFDPRGRLVKRAGRKGQGPGEFMNPRLLALAGDLVFATDQNVPALSVFDRDLAFLKRIAVPGMVHALRVLPNGGIAVALTSYPEAGRVVILDGEGRIVRTVAYAPRGTAPLSDSVCLAAARNGDVFLGFLFEDRVERWSSAGARLWSKSLMGGGPVEKKTMNGITIPIETCVIDVALDGRGRLYVLGGKRARNRSRDVYVVDPDGSVLTVFTLPDTSHALYFDDQDFLYVRADAGMTLKKYRVVVP
jgi:hypothetical protein